jgi:AcrR family transcriptional regulator
MQETERQSAQLLLRRFVQDKGEPEGLESLLEERIPGDRPPEETLNALIGCFLSVRDLLHQGTLADRFPLSRLMAVYARVAQKRNIGTDLFYATLMEKVVEVEKDEPPKGTHKQSTKERILDAALEVFSEKGFHLATVDEIAERADLGKGTLYRYFANKETLFNELVRLRLEELEKSAMAALDDRDDVLTMIAKYLRVYFEFFDSNQQLYRLIAQERLDFSELVQDLYFKKVMRRIHTLKKKIYEASQQGVLKDVDFQTVFYGVMGFVHGVIQKWLARDCSYSLVDELPGVLEVLFYGFVK